MKIGLTGTKKGITPPQFDLLVEVLQELHEVTEAHHGDWIGAEREFAVTIDAVFGIGKMWLHRHPPDDDKKRAFTRYDVDSPAATVLVRNKDSVHATEIVIA